MGARGGCRSKCARRASALLVVSLAPSAPIACSSSAASPHAAAIVAPMEAGVGASTVDGGDDVIAACVTRPLMDFGPGAAFFDSPFPSDARLTAAGAPDLSGFPNHASNTLASQVIGLVASGAHAFSTTASVYFRFSSALDVSDENDPHASLAAGASVFLVDVDPSSPDVGTRIPSRSLFLGDGGPYGASNLLAVLPYPGMTLLPATRYAAVVLRTQRDTAGKPVCAAAAVGALAGGTAPAGMSASSVAEYEAALGVLAAAGVQASSVAAMTVFTTDTPTAQFEAVRDAMLALPLPQVAGAWTPDEVFPTYCVFHNTIPMPEYQGGTPPYTGSGGGWVFDAAGTPVLQRTEMANLVVTVPRAPMPAAGYPLVNMSRTGAGGNRPLVDRGQEATNGGPSIVAGTGPALYFAAAGFAGASIDGPLGGLRNPIDPDSADDEDFTIFNVANPEALRDNIRQSAAEMSLTASILANLSFDASSCPGATTADGGPIHFDERKMALMSHSMGSTISPLTLAFEPRYRAAILSGAGGSWIENIIYKLEPLAVKPAVELLLGIEVSSGYSLGEGDPLVNLFQWAAESADPPVYDSRTVHHPVDAPPRNVLKVQGIIDHYILPPICNATTLSLGLDLAGPGLDVMNPGLSTFTPLGEVLDLSGGAQLALPAGGNVTTSTGTVTAIVTQHPADGIEDGHEVIFQTDPPKHEYVCLLRALAGGETPRIPVDGPALSPCE